MQKQDVFQRENAAVIQRSVQMLAAAIGKLIESLSEQPRAVRRLDAAADQVRNMDLMEASRNIERTVSAMVFCDLRSKIQNVGFAIDALSDATSDRWPYMTESRRLARLRHVESWLAEADLLDSTRRLTHWLKRKFEGSVATPDALILADGGLITVTDGEPPLFSIRGLNADAAAAAGLVVEGALSAAGSHGAVELDLQSFRRRSAQIDIAC